VGRSAWQGKQGACDAYSCFGVRMYGAAERSWCGVRRCWGGLLGLSSSRCRGAGTPLHTPARSRCGHVAASESPMCLESGTKMKQARAAARRRVAPPRDGLSRRRETAPSPLHTPIRCHRGRETARKERTSAGGDGSECRGSPVSPSPLAPLAPGLRCLHPPSCTTALTFSVALALTCPQTCTTTSPPPPLPPPPLPPVWPRGVEYPVPHARRRRRRRCS
jgi:hypothetical protein